jgi:polysaccharide biosynthesis transport protein
VRGEMTHSNLPPSTISKEQIAMMPAKFLETALAAETAKSYPYFPQFGDVPFVSGKVDLQRLLFTAQKYKMWVLSVASLTILTAAVITYLMTPIYRATSSIQIDRETVDVANFKGIQAEQDPFGDDFYQTKYELLASRSLAARVVKALALTKDQSFITGARTAHRSFLGIVLGTSQPLAKNLDDSAKLRATVDAVLSGVSITPVRGSRVVHISFDHPDAAVALKIANTYAQVFITDNLDRRYDATSYARTFLEERLQQLKGKLEESEKQLVRYAEKEGLVQLADDKNLALNDLESTNSRLADVKAARVKAELAWNRAKETDGFGLKEILDNPTIQDNLKTRSLLAAQYQQKLGMFKPAFPDMVQLHQQIQELDAQAEREIRSIKKSIESTYLNTLQEEQKIREQLAETKNDVSVQRNSTIEYTILKRETDTNRSLYDGLLQRYKEIGVTGAVGNNNISIIDEAILPASPLSPNMMRNLALGFAVGLVLGLLAAFMRDYLDDSFKSPADIERNVGLNVLGIVPKPSIGMDVDMELLNARSSMSEAIRSLRTGLQFATEKGFPKTMLITSSKASEGKTTTSIALAKSLASIGMNVLLIDADLRGSSVHRKFSCSNAFGLSDVLRGEKTPQDVVQKTDVKNLFVMTAGNLPENPAELLSGPLMETLLEFSAQSFNFIVIDGPPILGLADAPLLASSASATLLVVAASETRRNTAKIALKRIQMARGNVIGALLSKFDAEEAGDGYGYGYGGYDYYSYGAKGKKDDAA